MGRYTPMTELKKRRKEQGLNQTRLAEMAGISQNAISGYETGARFPSRNILEKLAKALACEARDLL